MYKYFILCLCVGLSGVLCQIDKEEGDVCEWEGVKRQCVKKTRCLTTLGRWDDHSVNRNVVMNPKIKFYWKDGTKARDSCLDYLKELPYKCERDFYSGISKDFIGKECDTTALWGIAELPPGFKSGREFPHQALLRYVEHRETINWIVGGSVISNKYILTAAYVNRIDDVGFVALGVENFSDSPSAWQIYNVKRFIAHPEYKKPFWSHDIALIETETEIIFNKNVLPACLHVAEANVERAIATTLLSLTSSSNYEPADTLQTIHLEKFSEDECKAAYGTRRTLKEGIDYNTQMCYGSKSHSPEACRGTVGEPLLVKTQFSRCIYTIIGVTAYSDDSYCDTESNFPNRYMRVAHYIPWIESIVWA